MTSNPRPFKVRGIKTSSQWIRSSRDLEAWIGALNGSASLAIDTESDSFYRYRFKVCLVQVADEAGRVGLLDTLDFQDLSSLGRLVADPRITKVFHGSVYDIALLKRDFGFTFEKIVDTEIAAKFSGREKFGLQALLESELGVRHSKKYQQFDWSRRPLGEDHEHYLAADVTHLLELSDRLKGEVRKLGRESWVREECEALSDIPAAIPREPADFMRAKGARDLSPRELIVLRELFNLREKWARRQDRPPFMIAGDSALLALAVKRPSSQKDLAAVGGVPSRLKGDPGGEILEAIRRARSIPEDDLPKRTSTPRLRRPRSWHACVDRLKAWRGKAAERLKLDPGIFMPARLLEALATAEPRDTQSLAGVPGVRKWRAEAFGRELLDVMKAGSAPAT